MQYIHFDQKKESELVMKVTVLQIFNFEYPEFLKLEKLGLSYLILIETILICFEGVNQLTVLTVFF